MPIKTGSIAESTIDIDNAAPIVDISTTISKSKVAIYC